MPTKRVQDKVSVKELLGLVPDKTLTRLARQTGVGHYARALYGKSMFYLLLYGLLSSEKPSLRALEDVFNSQRFKLLFKLDAGQKTRYNSISDRLSTMELSFFEQAYRSVYSVFRERFSKKEAKGYHIVRVGSPMVAETANKLKQGMCVGRKKDGKKQVKYTLCMEDLLPCGVQAFTGRRELNEDLTIPATILKTTHPRPGTVFVFDRGVQSRQAYQDIAQKEWLFVTRPKENTRYCKAGEETAGNSEGLQIGNLTIETDGQVYLYDGDNKKTKMPFRLVRAKTGQGKKLLFLSNIKDAAVEELIAIYKKRWDIKVFFRFVKQELNFSHLTSTNVNGIRAIPYMALALPMLAHIYKKRNDTGFKTAKRRMKMELEDLLTIMIVQVCGGNPNLFFKSP